MRPTSRRSEGARADGTLRMVRTYGLTHIALAVQDAERAFSFYRDVFGMVSVYRGDGFVHVFQRERREEVRLPGF